MFVVRKEFLVLGNRTSAWVPYEGIKGVKAQRCCVRLRASLMTNIQQLISPIERRQTRHPARIITVLRLVWVFHSLFLESSDLDLDSLSASHSSKAMPTIDAKD